MVFAVNPDMSYAAPKFIPAFALIEVNEDDVEMSPIEMTNNHASGEFVDAYSSPQHDVDMLENRVISLKMTEESDSNSIIDEYNGEVVPSRMIATPAPSRSILRKVSKYDSNSVATVTSDREHNAPIISALPLFADTGSQGYPVKVRRMSSSGTPMSSAAAILDNLKSALKLSSRRISLSTLSSASSSTTSLVEDGQSMELPRALRFNANVFVGETFHREDYDRSPGEMIAKKLTAQVAMAVKRELNEFKSREMAVHTESHHNTVFYPL